MASERITSADDLDRSAAGSLEITVQPDPEGIVLLVEGEIDLATAPTLQLCLETVTTGGADSVIVDLEGVTFMDSTGIAVLAFARQRLTEGSGSLRVRNPAPLVERLLRLVGIHALLVDAPGTFRAASS